MGSSGVELIAAERLRQIESEGWSAEHDDWHMREQLAMAAAAYAIPPAYRSGSRPPFIWPSSWSEDWWKPGPDRIRDLAKAGAMIAAEIDRLQRRATAGGERE